MQICTQISFTIPAATPSGKYLLRVEQFTWWPEIQFYLNCAHIEVRGSGKGVYTFMLFGCDGK
jgi:hypothetical protein